VFREGSYGSEWDLVQPCRRCRRDKIYRDRYGITLVEVEDRLEKQGFTCAICVLKIPSIDVGNVDMDRSGGVLRGILCDDCSWVLRRARLSATALHGAAVYLEKHAEMISKRQYSAADSRSY
jgi:hypothetical protein